MINIPNPCSLMHSLACNLSLPEHMHIHVHTHKRLYYILGSLLDVSGYEVEFVEYLCQISLW